MSTARLALVGRAYPGTVDGLIYCASMVLLDSARRGITAPVIARWLLAAGIGATLLANITGGLSWGPLGAVVAAWPALALVGSYELLTMIIRGSVQPGLSPAADTVPSPSLTDAQTAAGEALARSAAGNPLSQNQLQAQFRLSRAEATKVRHAVRIERPRLARLTARPDRGAPLATTAGGALPCSRTCRDRPPRTPGPRPSAGGWP